MLRPIVYITNRLKIKYFIFLFIHFSLVCYSQQTKINLTFKEIPLSEAIKEISKQSKINILYNPSILPENLRITGTYKGVTFQQSLDSILKNTQVFYKFFKKDVVLYRKNEEISEKHNIYKPVIKEDIPEKKVIIVTDTITYSVIKHDTVITRLTDIIKVPVMDTIKVFDTVKVVHRVNQSVNTYKPKKQALIGGISVSQGIFYSTIHLSNPKSDSTGIIKSALREKSNNALSAHFMYRYKSWVFETGLGFSKQKYTIDYSNIVNEFVTRTDTIDKYFTSIKGNDTTWVYITEDRLVEISTKKTILSDLIYQYINVPVFAGYSKVFKKLTFDFKGGILINYYLGSKGVYLTVSEDNKVMINKSKAPNSKFSIDVFGAIGIDYFLNEKTHIFASPYIGYTAISPGNKNMLYYSTNLQFGIQTGLRYFF